MIYGLILLARLYVVQKEVHVDRLEHTTQIHPQHTLSSRVILIFLTSMDLELLETMLPIRLHLEIRNWTSCNSVLDTPALQPKAF